MEKECFLETQCRKSVSQYDCCIEQELTNSKLQINSIMQLKNAFLFFTVLNSDQMRKIHSLCEFVPQVQIQLINQKNQKMKYAIISNQKRVELLKRVLKNKEPVKTVADQLKIKFPSAKSIIRTYKKTGRVFNKKKTRKIKPLNKEKIQLKDTKSASLRLENQNSIFQKFQEKSQNIPTQNQNNSGVQNRANSWQLPLITFSQSILAYSMMPQTVFHPYYGFSSYPYYSNPYPY